MKWTHDVQPLMHCDCYLSAERFGENQHVTWHCIIWPLTQKHVFKKKKIKKQRDGTGNSKEGKKKKLT